jgi:hypothetical protein
VPSLAPRHPSDGGAARALSRLVPLPPRSASEKGENDPTGCTTWGHLDRPTDGYRKVMLIMAWKKHLPIHSAHTIADGNGEGRRGGSRGLGSPRGSRLRPDTTMPPEAIRASPVLGLPRRVAAYTRRTCCLQLARELLRLLLYGGHHARMSRISAL